MSESISRRDLLRGAVASALALASPGHSAAPVTGQPLRRAGAPKKVVVVGAGLAGLSAAFELSEVGHQVTLLEARPRAGGRVYTLRQPFSDGLYAEAGAIYVPASHQFTIRYVRRFGLPLDPVPARSATEYFYIRGRRFPAAPDSGAQWPLRLAANERASSPFGILLSAVGPVLEQIGDPDASGWPPEPVKQYDQMTLAQLLRRQGVSPDAVALLKCTYLDLYGDGIESASALFLLREIALAARQQDPQTWVIRGGTDRLPEAFAGRLAARIRYGAVVTRLEQDAREVRVTFQERGARQTLAADQVICAVPFSVLKRVEFAPPLSPGKARAVEQLPYTSVTRIYLQTRRRFWAAPGDYLTVATDLPIMWTRDATFNQAGARGILETYMAGAHARSAAAMSGADRLAFARREMDKVYPGTQDNFERGASHAWDDEEWSRGDYAWFRPGQMVALLPHIARSEGRIHFAGEHASARPGWMDGALASGNRAARAVNDS
jgi:monoamine oxidase